MKSLEAELCGFSPDHNILPHVPIGHGATVAVQKPVVCVGLAVGFACEQCGYPQAE